MHVFLYGSNPALGSHPKPELQSVKYFTQTLKLIFTPIISPVFCHYLHRYIFNTYIFSHLFFYHADIFFHIFPTLIYLLHVDIFYVYTDISLTRIYPQNLWYFATLSIAFDPLRCAAKPTAFISPRAFHLWLQNFTTSTLVCTDYVLQSLLDTYTANALQRLLTSHHYLKRVKFQQNLFNCKNGSTNDCKNSIGKLPCRVLHNYFLRKKNLLLLLLFDSLAMLWHQLELFLQLPRKM